MLYPGRGDRAMGKAFAAWLMVAGVVAAPATGPRETVETAVVRVVEVLQQPEATGPAQSERAAEIKRIARELFDFDEIARRALSRHWAGRTPVQHTEFVGLFTGLLERSYMNRIEAYAGEQIVYTGEAVDGTYATVRSKVLTQQRNEVGIDYRLHRRGNRWLAYDVLIDGVSFVSTFRAQFDRVIHAESYRADVDRPRDRARRPLDPRSPPDPQRLAAVRPEHPDRAGGRRGVVVHDRAHAAAAGDGRIGRRVQVDEKGLVGLDDRVAIHNDGDRPTGHESIEGQRPGLGLVVRVRRGRRPVGGGVAHGHGLVARLRQGHREHSLRG